MTHNRADIDEKIRELRAEQTRIQGTIARLMQYRKTLSPDTPVGIRGENGKIANLIVGGWNAEYGCLQAANCASNNETHRPGRFRMDLIAA